MYYNASLSIYYNFLLLSTDPFFFPILGISVFCVAISKSGFGGGLGGLGFPIMVLVLPPKFALAVFLPLIILTDIWVVFLWRKFFLLHILWMMVLGGVLGQLACWFFFNHLNDNSILILIGLMALITSVKYFITKFFDKQNASTFFRDFGYAPRCAPRGIAFKKTRVSKVCADVCVPTRL